MTTDSTEVRLHFLDYWRVVRNRISIILVVFLITVVTAGIFVYFMPRQYYSKVTIEVKPEEFRGADLTGVGSHVQSDMRLQPTQFNIIQQTEILYPVIDNLGLLQKWGAKDGQPLPKEAAYWKLRKMLDMREVRNTDLIDIGVYSTDKDEAAQIANSIAVVYQDKRRNDQLQIVDRALAQLQEQVEMQRKKAETASVEQAKIAVQQGIVDPDPNTLGTGSDIDTQTVRATEQQVDESRGKVAELRTQLQQIEKLSPDELMVALHLLNIDDPTVAKVLPLYQESVAEEARLINSGLGPNHPKIKSLRASKQVYGQQLSEQIGALRKMLGTRLEIAQTTLTALESKLDESRKQFTERKTQTSDYLEAKATAIQAKRLLEDTERQLATQRMQMGITPTVAKIWSKAEPALGPSKPNVLAYMSLAVFVGLLLGVGLAFFLEYLDTSVKTLDDVEKFLGVPVLAVVPKGVSILMNASGDSPHAEAFRILRTNIEFNRKTPNANSITIVSGGPGEGKSTTLCNLAFTCAKGGYNVLVVDADLRRPSQHRLFNIDNRVGLTNYLTGNMPFEEIVRATQVENLSFIPSGLLPQDAVGILNSQRMIELINEAKRSYDMVFFDSPPILGVSDGSVLASEVDISVMVIEHRRFPRSMLQRVKQAVTSVGGNLLGVVLNKVDARHEDYGYYGGYYDYYAPQREDAQPKPPRARAARTNSAPNVRPIRTGSDQY